ncbi:MAG TPA: poly-beta-hydroxybutyrate polymerase N-terminal domain-containing protein, partial [Accumulibacter sp.]
MADTPNDTTQATATVAADAATDGAPAKRRARPANPGATPRRRKTATAAAGNPAPAVEVAAPPAPPLAATASPADPPPVNAEPAVKPSEAGAPATAGGTSGTHFSRRLGDRHLLDSDALENIDRMTNIALGQLSGGVSPASLAMAYLDWVVHLSASPGKQFQLGAKAARKALRLASYALNSAMTGSAEDCIKPLPGDHRFDHPGWQQFPFNVIYQGFLLNQQWWHNATTGIRGVSKHSEAAVWFIAKQILDMMAPANMPAMNPEIVEATIKERGANLTRG